MSTHHIRRLAFDWIILLRVILPVSDIITATAIIEAVVAGITKVVVAVILVHNIPIETIAEAAPGGGLAHMTSDKHGHLDGTTISHDLTKDINLTHAARADLNHPEEDTVIIPTQSLQIGNVPGVL